METTTFDIKNVAEIELRYATKVKPSLRPRITRAGDAVEIFRAQFAEGEIELREIFYVMYLNRANRVLGVRRISEGSVAGCICEPGHVFAGAILANAAGIVLCHNHPSGNLAPSEADKQITKQIREGAKLLGFQLVDHIILSPEEDKYYSFAEEGTL